MSKAGYPTKSEQLYFIAIVPPPPIYDEAWALKNYFKTKYNSKASLNSPPHITLHMPFKWKESKEEDLIRGLEKFALQQSSFEIQLRDFSCFKPRVIFIDVVENDQLNVMQNALSKFCKAEFNLFNANYQDNPFHPHLTLAFRDLRKSRFTEAWQEFQERKFDGSWHVDHMVLLKHDGDKWNPLIKAAFSG